MENPTDPSLGTYEDDTPRRFKDLLTRPKSIPKSKTVVKKGDDEWTVRPGESFRQFNTRIREAGLSVPPGVPETFRGGAKHSQSRVESSNNCINSAKPSLTTKPLPKFSQAEGDGIRQKRKEHLKNRRVKRVRDSGSDLEEYEQRGIRDVVKAPPTIKVAPKATLKLKERRQNNKRKPSLLPLIRKQ
jgi:hypothetical protein